MARAVPGLFQGVDSPPASVAVKPSAQDRSTSGISAPRGTRTWGTALRRLADRGTAAKARLRRPRISGNTLGSDPIGSERAPSHSRVMVSRPVVVVAAAGRSRRFGGPGHKLAQRLGSSTVLGTTLAQVLASALPLVVVTTESLAPEAARVVARKDLILLPPEEADRGFGHSIAAGVTARSQAPGWVVLPGDMPLVGPRSLVAVAAALDDHPVVYAQHHGRRGHPVGYSSGMYSELAALAGDEDARRLLGRFPAVGVDVEDPGVLFDVDTESDLDAARALVPPLSVSRLTEGVGLGAD